MSRNIPDHLAQWWSAKTGEAHKKVFDTVRKIESMQFDVFDRFVKLEAMYDPEGATGGERGGNAMLVTENAIARNIDTVAATVAATDVRSRYQTDGGDWSTQRTARHLEWYSEAMATVTNRHAHCHAAFKEGAKKGTGCVAVYVDRFDKIRVEHVLPDDVVVPLSECRNNRAPRQMHRRVIVQREELLAEYPEHEEKILQAQQRGSWDKWAGYRPLEPNDLVKLESWRLPFGVQGQPGYIAGRHTMTIDGLDLLDEEWHKDHFPIYAVTWTTRNGSWYGISLAERIMGHQRTINKMNWQADRNLDQIAVPITFVDPIDVNATVKAHKAGAFVVIRGKTPETKIPVAVGGEVWNRIRDLNASADGETGVSQMASRSMKPSGIDSGVAMREYRDMTTVRFSPQEKSFEDLNCMVDWAILECCKDLGAKAPKFGRRKWSDKRINWARLDLVELRISQAPASTLSRTPAGRTQHVMEIAQAGIISTDEARRLIDHPDIEYAMSMATAALESAEYDFEQLADGHVVMPEPYANLKTCEVRGQMKYNKWRVDGAPEAILEALRQYIVQAVAMQQPPANANVAAAPGAAAAMPAAGGAIPGMSPAPVEAQPAAALSQQAMQLRAV